MTRIHRHKHQKAQRTLVIQKKSKPLLVDRLTFVAAIVEPFFVLPQLYQIFRYHDASGVSIISWLGFNILTIVWVWYAIEHKEKMVLIYQGLFFIFQSLVILGAIMYGGAWY
jgi:uncharacterized protein with PQ loop repeat